MPNAPVSDSLYVSPNGRPGRDIEGDGSGDGVLGLRSNVAGGTFQFVRLDFSAYNIVAGTPGTITVTGLLGSATIGSDTYMWRPEINRASARDQLRLLT